MQALGLRRIILIDSFITAKSVAIEVDAHANLSGTNGAGKTTCLRLIPFFYGMEPGQLENQAAGKKSFVDWYLPRASSLIIFEYKRNDGLCCAVVYRHPTGTKPAYRFKRGGFAEDEFCLTSEENNKHFLPGQGLASHWRSLDIEFSSQLEIVVDYRAIIQQDRELLNRSQRAKQLRPIAARFCLGDNQSRMRHIEKVALAILGRQGSMEKIKLMLADIMQEDGLQVPLPPKHKDNKYIGDDLASLRDFKTHIPRFKQIITTEKELCDSKQELAQLHYSLTFHQQKITHEQHKLQSERDELVQAMAQQESEWRNQQDTLQNKITQTRSETKQLDQRINQLQTSFDDYENQQFPLLNQDYEQLSQLKTQQQQAKENWRELTDEVKNEQNQLEQKQSNELIRHHKINAETNQQMQSAQNKLSELKQQHLETINQMEANFHQQQKQDLEQSQQRREQLLTQKIQAQNQVNNAQADDKQLSELEQINVSIDDAENKITELETQLSQVDSEHLIQWQKYQQSQQDYNQANLEVNQLQQKLDELQRWLNPQATSWIKQLQLNEQPWQQTLGKIIKPEVLLATDLNPKFNESSSNCYGWELDLNHVKSSEINTDLNQLHQQQQQTEQALQLGEKNQQNLKKTNTELAELCESLSRQIDEKKRLLKKTKLQKTSLRDNVNRLNEQINESITEKKLSAKQQVKQLTEALEQHQSQWHEHSEQKHSQHQQALQQQQANFSLEQSQTEQLIEGFKLAIEDEKKLHQQNKTQLKAQFDQLLDDKGIDKKLISKARETLEQLTARIEKIEASQQKIQEYRHFIKTLWPQKSTLEKDYEQVKRLLTEAEHNYKQAHSDYQLKRSNLVSEKASTEQRLTQNNSLLGDCDNLLSQLTIEPKEKLIDLPLMSLIQRAKELLKLEIKLVKKINDGIYFVQQQISKRAQSQIALAWEQECQAIILNQQLDTESPEHLLHLPKALKNLIDVNIPQLEQTLIETTRVIGNQLNLFYQGLRDINQHLHNQANKISRIIEQYTIIDALSDINIDMKSKIEELDYWQQLKQFSSAWGRWQQHESTLPPVELIDHFAIILTLLDKARFNQSIASLFTLHIHMHENGRHVIISNDNDLLNASSAGLSYLALCAIFVGISRLLCPDKSIAIHWPIDELGIIAPENINHLFTMLDSAGIVMLGGFPNTDPDLLKHFSHKHLIDKKFGIKMMSVESNSLLERIKQQQANTTGEVA